MNLDQAASTTGYSVAWLDRALERGLIRARPQPGGLSIPDEEIAFLTRSRRWLPHLLDAVVAEGIASAILFGRDAVPTDTRARVSLMLTTVDDPERALDLNGIMSAAGGHEIYVVTWSTGVREKNIFRDAVLTGRVLRDDGLTWRRFVEGEFRQADEPALRGPAERDRLRELLEQWASVEPADD